MVMTALENVTLPMILKNTPKDEAIEKATKILTQVGLGHRIDHLPMQLSGGQMQRVAIARALANSPAIILADEPTGNLDSKTGEEVINLLKQLQDDLNITIITATHDVKMLNISDRIAWIRDGKLDRLEERANVKIDTGSMG
jgi:putative ABC transport system ATP-binding protein